ncbi:uncharacterized protein L201_006105 [Kwoniella dendrophila CBS 6074]|uniref:F-box domain-containing protein n=1 Tax=Kwoniella dendrophila CBS 6074 TaxID=1295534 RepID=A0AAX4K230_9TREE
MSSSSRESSSETWSEEQREICQLLQNNPYTVNHLDIHMADASSTAPSTSTAAPQTHQAELVWYIDHLRDDILSHLEKKDVLKLLQVNRFYFEIIVWNSTLYQTISMNVYTKLKEGCPKKRRDVYFNAVRELEYGFSWEGRLPSKHAQWEEILKDLPNLPSISRGKYSLHRSTEHDKEIFIFEYGRSYTINLGERHPRLFQSIALPKKWILRPNLDITISSITDITDINERSRVFQDSVSIRVKALEGRLKFLDIQMPLPTYIIRNTLEDLYRYGYLALTSLSIIQYDDEIINHLNVLPETLKHLTISSRSYASTYISIIDLITQVRWNTLPKLDGLKISCKLPPFEDFQDIHLEPPNPFTQDNVDATTDGLRNVESQLIFPVNHPMSHDDQISSYFNLIRKIATYLHSFLIFWGSIVIHVCRPTISSYSDKAGGILHKNEEYSRKLDKAFEREWRRLDKASANGAT